MLPPQFRGSQEKVAKIVARDREFNLSIERRYLSNVRLLLLGDGDSLRPVCEVARAAQRDALGERDAFIRPGLLSRVAAAALREDAFHFLVAVPVGVVADLLRAQVFKKNARREQGPGAILPDWVQDAASNMFACIRESGVGLNTSFDIELNGGVSGIS